MWKYLKGLLCLQFKRWKLEHCIIKRDSTTVILFCIKVGPSHSNFFICFNNSHSEMMKNAFYLILKAFFVIKIFEFSERLNKNFLWKRHQMVLNIKKFSIFFLRLILYIQVLMYRNLDFHVMSEAAIGVLLVSALMLFFFSSKNSSYIWKKKNRSNSKACCCSDLVVSTTT